VMSKLVYEIYLFCIGLDSGSAGTATGRKPGATHPAGMIREELPSGGSTQTSVGEDRGLAVARNTRSATHLKRLPQGRLSASTRCRLGEERLITLKQACSKVIPPSATCVQRFDDSRSSAIHITYRSSLRSSSMQEPRYPLLTVVFVIFFLLLSRRRPAQCALHTAGRETRPQDSDPS